MRTLPGWAPGVVCSVLREDFDPERSDLDFLVEFAPMSPSGHAEAYFGLLEDLESLFGRRVDLVEIGAVRNPYLRREIEERQETLVGCCGCCQREGLGYEA